MKLSEIGQLLNVTDAFSGETDVAGLPKMPIRCGRGLFLLR